MKNNGNVPNLATCINDTSVKMVSVTHAIKIDADIEGGTPCFAGTRVPMKSLSDAIAHGRPIDYFLSQFPSVSPEQAVDVLQEASQLVTNPDNSHAA